LNPMNFSMAPISTANLGPGSYGGGVGYANSSPTPLGLSTPGLYGLGNAAPALTTPSLGHAGLPSTHAPSNQQVH
jgi:hypothetical protein